MVFHDVLREEPYDLVIGERGLTRLGQGRIINISSVLGLLPAPYSAHYSATKHALEGYSESLDHEIRAFNIRVSLIEPAYTRSVFEQNALEAGFAVEGIRPSPGGRPRARAGCHDHGRSAGGSGRRCAAGRNRCAPWRRYTAGKIARQVSVLRRFAPAEIFDKSLRKQMRLPA